MTVKLSIWLRGAYCALALGAWLACSAACNRAGADHPTAPAAAPAPSPTAAVAPAAGGDCDTEPVAERLRSQPLAAVILVLRETDSTGTLAQRADRVLRDLGPEFQLGRRYAAVAALAGKLTAQGLAVARSHPDVRCVQLDGDGGGTQPLP